MRSFFQLAGTVVVLVAMGAAAAQAGAAPQKSAGSLASTNTHSLSSGSIVPIASFVTLPPQEKITHHWPWWLRLLAVVGVLVFIRFVAGSVRSKPSGPGPVG